LSVACGVVSCLRVPLCCAPIFSILDHWRSLCVFTTMETRPYFVVSVEAKESPAANAIEIVFYRFSRTYCGLGRLCHFSDSRCAPTREVAVFAVRKVLVCDFFYWIRLNASLIWLDHLHPSEAFPAFEGRFRVCHSWPFAGFFYCIAESERENTLFVAEHYVE